MRSTLLQMADYKTLPLKPFEKRIPRSKLDEDILCETFIFRLSKRRIEQAETIEKGDIVTLKLSSVKPYFNREECSLNAGMGLFSEELEKQLIGHKTGEIFTSYVGEEPVEVTILENKRVYIPNLTDKFVLETKPEGVSTRQEYYDALEKRCLNDYKGKYLNWYAEQFFSKWCAACKWDIAEEDLDWDIREQNVDSEEKEMRREFALSDIKVELLDAAMCGRSTKDSSLARDQERINEVEEKIMGMIEDHVAPFFSICIQEDK